MPRIKQLLAEGKFVRMFGLGQLISPKLVEIVGEHGGFDALWLDAEHAGLAMKEIEWATMIATVLAAARLATFRARDDRSCRLDHEDQTPVALDDNQHDAPAVYLCPKRLCHRITLDGHANRRLDIPEDLARERSPACPAVATYKLCR